MPSGRGGLWRGARCLRRRPRHAGRANRGLPAARGAGAMKRPGMLALAAAWLLAACTTTTPGTGWSRAPDLSVYSAMTLFGDVAHTEAVLCGYSRTMEGGNWREDFAAREQAV